MKWGIIKTNGIEQGEFWVTDDTWNIIHQYPAYKMGNYSDEVNSFMKQNNLTEIEFRDKLNLCSIDQAIKREENMEKIKMMNEEDRKFLLDSILNSLQGY